MNFREHYELEGTHAFLSPSKFYWLNYDREKLVQAYLNHEAAKKGTRLHNYAKESILLEQKLPRARRTLNMYVNDAIGYAMTPEQGLFYTTNCFGTADTISFRKKCLRIHDLKTGISPAHMEQLEIYAALFCLEYKVKPSEISTELRIYQNDDVLVYNPTAGDLNAVIDKVIEQNKIVKEVQDQGGYE